MSVNSSAETAPNFDQRLEISEVKNRLARLIESGHNRILHGLITRTPEDAAFDELVDGRPHARTYHIQPQNSIAGSSYHGPTFIIEEADVESIVLVDAFELPTRSIIWLP